MFDVSMAMGVIEHNVNLTVFLNIQQVFHQKN